MPTTNRGAAETHPTPAVRYATAYSSFLENRKFSRSKAKYDCASRGVFHATHFLFMFYFGLFPVPPEDVNLKVRRFSFPCHSGVLTGVARKRN